MAHQAESENSFSPVSITLAKHRAAAGKSVWTRRIELVCALTERFGAVIAGLLLLATFAAGLIEASRNQLWLDEILGLLIAKLPKLSDISAISASGAQNDPMIAHLIIRTSLRVLRNDGLGVRLPALIGFVVFCWSLYIFVARVTSRLFGLIAMVFPVVSGAWFYASDGRPYGLWLGFAGLACVSWQAAALRRGRKLFLIGLALSLLLAFNMHLYAALLLIPFAAAELSRTYLTGRLDRPMWFAILTPALTFVPYGAAARTAQAHLGAFDYSSLGFWSAGTFAAEMFEPFALLLVAIGCIYLIEKALSLYTIAPRFSIELATGVASRREETLTTAVLAIGLSLFPVLTVTLSRYVTHIFFTRYALPGAFGFAAVLGLVLWFGFSGRTVPAFLTFIVMATSLCGLVWRDAAKLRHPDDVTANVRARIPLRVAIDNLPVTVETMHAFMEFQYYLDPKMKAKLVYLTDEEYSAALRKVSISDRIMTALAPYFRTRVIDFTQFTALNSDFYMIGGRDGWLGHRLLQEGAQMELLNALPPTGPNYQELVVRVHMPSRSESSAALMRNLRLHTIEHAQLGSPAMSIGLR